jgi:hypothetical protein
MHNYAHNYATGGGEDVPEKRNSTLMLSDPINLDEKNIFFYSHGTL